VAIYNQAEIDALIVCEKIILEPPKRAPRLVGADWRNDMRLAAPGDAGEFLVFMRQSDDFPENFSVGLTYHPKDGRPEIVLLRCNGPHGVYNGSGSADVNHSHWNYHIHKANEKSLEEGFRAEKSAEKTLEYASYNEAVDYFVNLINVRGADADKHFPKNVQSNFFK